MKNVTFSPAVGEHYQEGFKGKKVLVLGESHYDVSNDEKDITKIVIQRFQEYQLGKGESFAHWMNTFTKFARSFDNKELEGNQVADFYDSVAFYNYVQESLDESRKSPTKEQFANSEKAFFEVLEELQPDVIIVWGHRLWDNMTANNVEYDEDNDEYYYVLNNGKKVLTVGIKHPSANNFSYESAYAVLKQYFDI